MANGDITYANIESMVKLGEGSFPSGSSETTMTQDDANALCTSINSEVNLILKNLGLALPISDTDSTEWLKLTKQFGSAALVIHGLGAQATEEQNTRADWYWEKYQERLEMLIESGGDILDTPSQSDPVPSTLPVVFGQYDRDHRKRFLRFPQRARIDHLDNDEEIRDSDFAGDVRGF